MIPIIGQPTIGDWALTFNVGCPCGTQFLMSGGIGVTKKCPNTACQKIYRMMAPPMSTDGVNLNISLGVGNVPIDVPPDGLKV